MFDSKTKENTTVDLFAKLDMGNITDDDDCGNLITNEGITEKMSI
jgi:hypothetical protein